MIAPIVATYPVEEWTCTGCGKESDEPRDYAGRIRLDGGRVVLRYCWTCIENQRAAAHCGAPVDAEGERIYTPANS